MRQLREEYDPQIRAAVQADVDAAVDQACQAAIDDADAPIEELISYDKSWERIADEADVIGLVEACSAEERAKTEEQREQNAWQTAGRLTQVNWSGTQRPSRVCAS